MSDVTIKLPVGGRVVTLSARTPTTSDNRPTLAEATWPEEESRQESTRRLEEAARPR